MDNGIWRCSSFKIIRFILYLGSIKKIWGKYIVEYICKMVMGLMFCKVKKV